MADRIQQILDKMAEIERRNIEGVASAYSSSPEALALLPAFLNYAVRGMDYREEASTIRGLYTVGAELHVARGLLSEAEKECTPFVVRFSDAMWADPTLDGLVDTLLYIRHQFTILAYAGEYHFGIRFELDYKLRRAVSV